VSGQPPAPGAASLNRSLLLSQRGLARLGRGLGDGGLNLLERELQLVEGMPSTGQPFGPLPELHAPELCE
jgi:hypothetical protein